MQPAQSVSKSYWHGSKIRFRQPVTDVRSEPVMLTTSDHADIRGIFWTSSVNPRPRVVVMASHPRSDFSFHHAFPDLLKAGYGCLGGNTRNLNNDMNCVHELLLLDIATYARWLKAERGVERIVLLGNSGGGSLYSFYQSQAKSPPLNRITVTPGGKPTGLDGEELVVADGLIFLAAHTGQGLILSETIDPAVIDEQQPLLSDPALDMYNPCNGFKPPPQWVEYSSAFVERYRRAQIERVERLDTLAHEMIAEGTRARTLREKNSHESLPDDVNRQLQITEAFEPIMIVYRTMANLHYVDRHLDPNERAYGSLFGDRPDIMNFRHRGFARVVTPHGWLSTWSGLSSNANILATAALITEPALVINAGRDRDVFPLTHSHKTFNTLSSVDKEYWEFPEAQHYFEAENESEGNRTLDALMARLVPWIEERFPL